MDKKNTKNRAAKKTRASFVEPKCNTHKDCFANKQGKCVCLSKNDFHGDCPFYKPGTEVSMDQIMRECRAYAETHGGKERV